jgi:hypothetical protein
VDNENGRILSGRLFTPEDLELVKSVTIELFDTCRAEISREICRRLKWFKIDGGLKDMSCKNVMARLEKEGLLLLPKPTRGNNNKKFDVAFSERTNLGIRLECDLSELLPIKLVRVIVTKDRKLWNEYVRRYHYLGYTPFPGAQIRYFIESSKGLLGCISFSASAWKTLPRDKWIGWTHEQRKARLHLIVNNSRFLIFPCGCISYCSSPFTSLNYLSA